MPTQAERMPELHFEFIVNDPRSKYDKKRIRQQVKRDVRRRRELQSAQALRLAGPLPSLNLKHLATSGPEVFHSVLPVSRTSKDLATSNYDQICLEKGDVLGSLHRADSVPVALALPRTTTDDIAGDPNSTVGRFDTDIENVFSHVLFETSDDSVSSNPEYNAEVGRGCELVTGTSTFFGNQIQNSQIGYSSTPSQLIPSLRSGCYDPFDSAIVPMNDAVVSYLTFFATSMWPAHPFKHNGGSFFKYFGSSPVDNEAFFYATIASAAARRASRLKTSQSQQFDSSLED
jgi:hypothetical protein